MRVEWLPFVAVAVAACGPSIPREQDIYHQASLRPGEVPARTDAEQELLLLLPTAGDSTTVEVGDQRFVVLVGYASASGRRCVRLQERTGTNERIRVACEHGDAWAFVPDVFDGEDPFAATEGPPGSMEGAP